MKNEKPYALSFFPKGGDRMPKPLMLVDNCAIEVAAVKKAEGNTDWIVRLFNSTAQKQTAQFKMPAFGVQRKLSFTPYEIQTLRVGAAGRVWSVNLMEVRK
jgi:alpha-mannosidase